jgi:hypothetical protein
MHNHPDHELPDELIELEERLCKLEPASMCCELHARLEQSMYASAVSEGGHEEYTHEFESLELHLRQMAPANMPDNMLARMVKAMDQWHDEGSLEQKVLAISQGDSRAKAKSPIFGFGFLAVAAGVALLAGIAALLVTDMTPTATNSLAQNNPAKSQVGPANIAGMATSSGTRANTQKISAVSDPMTSDVVSSKERIIYDASDNPYRLVEVYYLDKVKVKSRDGRDIILTRPRKDRYLIPIKMH